MEQNLLIFVGAMLVVVTSLLIVILTGLNQVKTRIKKIHLDLNDNTGRTYANSRKIQKVVKSLKKLKKQQKDNYEQYAEKDFDDMLEDLGDIEKEQGKTKPVKHNTKGVGK